MTGMVICPGLLLLAAMVSAFAGGPTPKPQTGTRAQSDATHDTTAQDVTCGEAARAEPATEARGEVRARAGAVMCPGFRERERRGDPPGVLG
jgi:hypothetical protein